MDRVGHQHTTFAITALAPEPNQKPAAVVTSELADTLRALGDEACAHHVAGRFAEAVARYGQMLSLKADVPEIYDNLGHALSALRKPETAILAFECAFALKPDNPATLCNWGLALAELDRFDEAEAKYRCAIEVNPGFAGAYNNLGLLMKAKGRLSEASNTIEQAIRLAPRNIAYYNNLSAIRPFAAGDPFLAALEALARNCAALSAADQIHLHFALAKAYENTGQPERAFQHLHSGNTLKRRQIAYDEAETLGQMDRLCELISRDFIEAHQGCGEPSSTPVFIIGMMRSGTTLIEQILASHPQVFGAGELHLLDHTIGSIRRDLPGHPPFPDMVRAMSAGHFRALGARYLEKIARLAPAAARITDKMTVNFLFAGLIHLALPNATIIHAVRDPVDTCVSCFATHFTEMHAHTYDLAELGRYYRHYRALMAHWQAVLPPGRILDVRYEELIADLEGVARRIVAHCGLVWDAHCLDFHRTERTVRTASAAQVRKPIYTDSVGRWRKYESFLGPLFAELQPHSAYPEDGAR
jgi:tetratricopeptide (TPR) repeat protein